VRKAEAATNVAAPKLANGRLTAAVGYVRIFRRAHVVRLGGHAADLRRASPVGTFDLSVSPDNPRSDGIVARLPGRSRGSAKGLRRGCATASFAGIRCWHAAQDREGIAVSTLCTGASW
jgi:hypothetical protein